METRTNTGAGRRAVTSAGALGDWLGALKKLTPQDEETRAAIARLLGLELRGTGTSSRGKTTQGGADQKGQEDDGGARARVVSGKAASSSRQIESVLTSARGGRSSAPVWVGKTQPLERTEARHLRPVLALEPLFPKRTTRAILSGALSTPSWRGPLDVARIVELETRAEEIRKIPRLSAPTLVRGVQMLIDTADGMQPFAADEAVLRAALLSVAGRDRTSVLYFEGTPLRGCGTGAKADWPAYAPPAPGTPIVVLTDLGIAQPPESAGRASAAEWMEFARVAVRALCPILALTPYPAKRWPPALAKRMTIVQWDQATTAASVRKLVGRALRVARAG